MRSKLVGLCLAVLCLALLGAECGGGVGAGGRGALLIRRASPVRNVDARCAALPANFPPGFAFVPGLPGLLLVASLGTTQRILPFEVEEVPPALSTSTPVLAIPLDSDGDGRLEGAPGGVSLVPILDDVFALEPGLGFATASGYEEVLVFSPEDGALISVEIEVPLGTPPGDYFFLPEPGSPELRTGISTFVCVRPPAGALDSRGDPVEPSFCDRSVPSYRTSFTSGAALAAGRLFVSTSNLGADIGSEETQFLPGTVLVFEFDRSRDPYRVRPDPLRPVLFTTAFNPTHVDALSVGGRDFVLVTHTGALGIEADDPDTPPIEGAALPLSEASVDVIDARSLEIVATIPLGLAAPAFGGLALDPTGRIGMVGSIARRALLGVDLAVLPGLPASVVDPIVLDRDEAVLFDAQAPFLIPGLPEGAPPESCPGELFGTSFDDSGQVLYATDFCDGSLSALSVDASGDPDTPELRSRFLLEDVVPLTAPLRPESLGLPRALGRVAVRPGVPNLDFQGPDLFFLVGTEGQVCGIPVASR